MDALNRIVQELDDVLAANTVEARDTVSGWVDPPWVPSMEERIDETGEHPLPSERHAPGRHAARWTADRVLQDALDGLDRVECITPRHKDRSYFGGAIPLLSHEIRLAMMVVQELTS